MNRVDIAPEMAPSTSLVRESVFLTLIMSSANVANVLFQIIMCRMLGEADYGVLMAMIGVIYILNVPADSFRTVMAFFAAKHVGGVQDGSSIIAGMYDSVMKRLLVISTSVLLVMVFCIPWLMRVFQLDGPGPLFASALVCISTLLLTTFQGVLQGTERFGWYGVSMNLWFWGRVVFSVLLVWLGFKATGALGGMVIGAVLGVLVPRIILHTHIFDSKKEFTKQQMRPLVRYTLKVLLMYAAFMVLANIDVLAVKHWFDKNTAGEFAQGAMLAHLLWLIPFPIVMAMFPKVVAQHRNMHATRLLLWKALGVSALAVGGTAFAFVMGRQQIFRFLFKADEHVMINLLPLFILAMVPVAMLFVLLNFELARERIAGVIPLIAGLLGVVVMMMRWHETPQAVLYVILCNAWLIFPIQLYVTWVGIRGKPEA